MKSGKYLSRAVSMLDVEPTLDPHQWERQHKAALKASEDAATDHAREWLEQHGVVSRPAEGSTRREALRAYIKRLNSLPRPESKAWAYEVISAVADGDCVPWLCEQNAREVVSKRNDHE